MQQQGYLGLGRAILDSAWRDLAYAEARNRREYRSARRFLESGLFTLICRAAGADPCRVRGAMLWRADRIRRHGSPSAGGRVAEGRALYRKGR